MTVGSQVASFYLLKIFRKFKLRKIQEEALYGKFDAGHWGIILAFSDVFRDIVILEWNQKNPEFRLKFRQELFPYFTENEAKICLENSKMKVECERTSYYALVKEILLDIDETIQHDKEHTFWTEDYELNMKA